jgi:lipopolysaccharide export LptBFGC system permease protein LptF
MYLFRGIIRHLQQISKPMLIIGLLGATYGILTGIGGAYLLTYYPDPIITVYCPYYPLWVASPGQSGLIIKKQ